jgi:hypothetical protein
VYMIYAKPKVDGYKLNVYNSNQLKRGIVVTSMRRITTFQLTTDRIYDGGLTTL